MDLVIKIITLLGAVIGVGAAIGILIGVNEIRSGMSNDDHRSTDKGITKIVMGGAIMLAVGGIVAYVITQLNAVKF